MLREGEKMGDLRAYTANGSGLILYNPKERSKRAPQDWDYEKSPLRLGYSYRDLSFVRLPLFAWEEFGLLTFFDTPEGFHVALMGPEEVAWLEESSGRTWRGHRLRVWEHMWGWLIAAAFVGVLVLQLREQRKWREAEGIL